MKKGYLYTTFFILATVVIFSLTVAFKYVKTPPKNDFDTKVSSKYADVRGDEVYTEIQNSWLRDIKDEYKDVPYFYSMTEIQLELN